MKKNTSLPKKSLISQSWVEISGARTSFWYLDGCGDDESEDDACDLVGYKYIRGSDAGVEGETVYYIMLTVVPSLRWA